MVESVLQSFRRNIYVGSQVMYAQVIGYTLPYRFGTSYPRIPFSNVIVGENDEKGCGGSLDFFTEGVYNRTQGLNPVFGYLKLYLNLNK